jgi:hypothetical protein
MAGDADESENAKASTKAVRTQQADESAGGLTETEPSCDCSDEVRRYTLEVGKDDKLKEGNDGEPIVVSITEEIVRQPIKARRKREAAGEASLLADCTTRPTTASSERKSCSSPWEEFTVPRGYVFAKERLSVVDHLSYGSENGHDVEWDDFVEVIPGLEAPRTLRFRVTARSGRDPGERGRTQRTATCPYVELP